GVPSTQRPVHLLDGLQRRPARPIAIRRGFHVRFEDRLQNQQGGGLNHPIPNHGNAEWPLPNAARLRNQHPPHRLGTVRLCPQRLLYGGQPLLQTCRFDVLERHAVHTRCPTVLLGERISVSEGVRPIHLVVQQVEAIGRFLLGLGVQRLSEPPELGWSCQAHANLPPLGSSSRTPNQGAFPPNWLCCPAGPNGTMRPSNAPRCLPVPAELRVATPRSGGSPVLRHALCRRATPITPVSDPAVIGRLLLRDPAAFPVFEAGRRSQHHFRGLLGLHTCCGPSARRPTHGGPMSRELQRFGCPPRRLGSYRGVPTTPRAGLSPARDTAPSHGALEKRGYEGGSSPVTLFPPARRIRSVITVSRPGTMSGLTHRTYRTR